jgi:hypothetical protein
MAIEYVVGLSCVPKSELGAAELFSRVKHKQQGETLSRVFAERGLDPKTTPIETHLRRPDGTETKGMVTVDQLLAEGESIAPLAAHCEGCPANLHRTAFGCWGAIAYPIRVETEKWLLGLLPADLSTTAGQLLLRAVEDFGYDGGRAAELRGEGGGAFFEDDTPEGVRWQMPPAEETDEADEDEAVELTVDQILQMMFFVGDVQPAHAVMLCLFLGVLPYDVDPDLLGAAIADVEARHGLLEGAQLPEPSAAPQIGAMRSFLAALLLAARLDVEVQIDA